MWGLLQVWEPRIADLPHSVLDIGCATGEFALAAQAAGWEGSGVELADTARKQAADRGLHMYETLEEPSDRFGLITMFHVLEHMIEPLPSLRRCRELVEIGGLLVIELPQWGSLGRRVRGSRWAQLRPPEHITFFNARSLATALSLTGWQVIRSASIYEQIINRSVEALHRREAVRGIGLAGAGLALERAGLGGYLRVVASPA